MRSIIFCVIAGFVIACLTGCAAGRAFSTGESLEAEGKYEEAMLSYAEAYRLAPEEMAYRARFLGVRDRAAQVRYDSGMARLKSGDFAAAVADFQVAYGLDPSKERYRQLFETAARKRDARQAYREGLDFEKDNKLKFAKLSYEKAVELDQEEADYRSALERVRILMDNAPTEYELNLKSLKPFDFKFTGSGLKDVFRILTQLSGINFIFDEGVRDQPVTISLEKTNFRQVLDLLTTMNKLGSSILNEKTVLIYPKTPDKIKQYENMKMQTFHLNYMDAKKAVNLIRTMLPARKVYVNEDSNSIVVRDTSDTIKVIEKLLDANDIPDAEVLLDVEVLELNDKNTRNVGLVLSRYAVDIGGFNLDSKLLLADQLSRVKSGDTTDAGIDNLVNVFTWNGFGGFVTVPNATYNFGKTIAKGEVLSNPKIRVKNKEKAKFTVGTRVPITTTTTNGTVGGYSVNVQYVDVGVKLNAEPVIQLNNVIDIKLSMEVSSIVGQETLKDGVTTVVTIGTRNLETVLSLKDGETSVIGGLKSSTFTDSKNKIFLLGDIPLLGPFISGNSNSKDKTEIVLAITPRLVRGLMAPPPGAVSFMSGKEDDPSLASFPPSSDEEPAGAVPLQGVPSGQATFSTGVAPRPGQSAGSAIQPVSGGTAIHSVTGAQLQADTGAGVPVPAVPVTGAGPPASAVTDGGQVLVSAPMEARVGELFTVEIRAAEVADLAGASFALTYDAGLVSPVSFAEGTFLVKKGVKTKFSGSADPAGAAVVMKLSLPTGTPGVEGTGVLATVVFRPLKPGMAAFGFRDLAFSNAAGGQIPVTPFATSIGIR